MSVSIEAVYISLTRVTENIVTLEVTLISELVKKYSIVIFFSNYFHLLLIFNLISLIKSFFQWWYFHHYTFLCGEQEY